MKTFLAECQRRRVFRLAGMYVVGCWAVLQVADLAFENWNVSPLAIRYVWVAAIVGLPVALFFSWRFDIVDGRIARTPEGEGTADLSLHSADYLILGALAAITVAAIYGVGTGILGITPIDESPRASAEADPRSIAVLPFSRDIRDNSDVAFLADGIQDELLTRLSRVTALKVTSRTSTERYRNTILDIPVIAADLGVSKILEGRVQQSGDRIRLNVQLIADDDTHLWAQAYDRQFTAANIFDIQAEVVESIARELEATITPQETAQLVATPTDDVLAYSAYLKARIEADKESVESLHAAIGHFNEALARDPDFALAHVGLADAYLTLSANFMGALKPAESVVVAEPHLVRALEIDPGLGEAYASLGLLRAQQGNPQAAEEAFHTAMRLRPAYARVFRLLGKLKWAQGELDIAEEWLSKALELDPYSVPVNFDIARLADVSGDFERALARYMRIVQFEPDYAFAYVYIAAIHYLVYGRAAESLVWYQKATRADTLSPSLASAQAIALLELGDAETARVFVDKALAMSPRTFWPLWTSLLVNLYTGDEQASRRDARTLLEVYPRHWGAMQYLRNLDIAAGRYEAAASRYARAYAELTDHEIPIVDENNYRAAVDLALVLMLLGDDERANDLLDGCLAVIEGLPRLGTTGYWIADARVYAVQGKTDLALAALREAIDEGWRLLSWLYLDLDPNLDAIRDSSEFRQLRQEVRDDLAVQAERAADLRASGDLRL